MRETGEIIERLLSTIHFPLENLREAGLVKF